MIPKAIPMEIRHIVFLLIFFILYVIFGGIVFMLLERPEEQIKKKEIGLLLDDFTEHIKKLNNSEFTEQRFRYIIHELLIAQENNLIDSFGNHQTFINWSFINSFFFAITVITTIGYGHLSPSTNFGKIFCIIYALFGIPITSLLIGSVADRFSKLYTPKKISRGLKRFRYERQLSARLLMLKRGLISLVPWFFAFLVVPALIFRQIEHWSFLDGFYYCFITLSTIGFGDFVAGNFERNYIWIYKTLVVFWIIFGLAYLSMVLNFITHSLRSRHISNVVQSLRLKINPSNGRIRRHHEDHCHHPNLYKRQQSSPEVIYNPNPNPNNNNNNNNNRLKKINPNNSNCISVIGDDKHLQDVESQMKTKRHTDHKLSLLKFLRIFKRKAKNNSHIQPKPEKNSIKCAFEEPIMPVVVRQISNSLPELSDVLECMDPCCSMAANPDHHQLDYNSYDPMEMVLSNYNHSSTPKITVL